MASGIELWRDYAGLHTRYPDPYSGAKVDFYCRNSEAIKKHARSGGGAEIAVTVVAHNEEKLIARTLASLNMAIAYLSDEAPDVQVIVVDNASIDSTGAIAKEFGAVVVSEPVKGIGRAHSSALCATNPRQSMVLSVDADVVVEKTWIERYSNVFDANPKLVFGFGNVISEFDFSPPFPIWIQGRMMYVGGQMVRAIRRLRSVHKTPGSANLAFRREVAIESGGYDETLVAGEDGDLMRKMMRRGEVDYVRGVDVIHSMRRKVGMGLGRWICAMAGVEWRALISGRLTQNGAGERGGGGMYGADYR